MNFLDPNDPNDRVIILEDLIENKIKEIGIEEVFILLYKPNQSSESLTTSSMIGSKEEIDFIITTFNFTQQIIFDFYEFKES